ncbi:MAG: hypothetical protein HOC78_03620 [Candidatus Komeilibacteria bacterium]|jgi:hypothetical protein|nr:hypothetical protein [Candidatus Komeilibacteria bacterium]
MDIVSVKKRIKKDRAILDASVDEGMAGSTIKDNFEILVKSLSQKLVLDLQAIEKSQKNLSKEEILNMQNIEVQKFKIKIADIAHIIDNKLKD